ncbi:MAG: fibronectin type III domain-containing protein [Bacteroidales bacterium]|nr:fibronectin type III domain-containing protein [Bacteroidales bacterium]
MRKELTLLALASLLLAACGGEKQDPVVTPDTPKAPSAPANVKLHKATETSLQFQWDAVDGATSYDWELQKDGVKVDGGNVGTRNVTVSGLTKATDYKFGVKAVNAGGSSSVTWVDAKTDGTEDPPTPPTPPSSQYYEQFSIPAAEEDGVARAFPGAEGGGMYTTGGRGGKIYHVTSLEDNNTQGTLRYGIENAERPLTIVFDVAGTIALQKQLQIKKGDLTIAGQTAPGDGICLKNYTFRIHASNVIVRFIRCRMGDEKQTEDDAMQIMDKYGDSFEKIIIDHCSVSWCTDECASFYGMKDFSFQWNIVSESLRNSIHDKGAHGYGGIWGGTNATYHHNLLAHHDSRNPRIDHDYVSHQKGPVSIFNNVVYNWKGNSCYGGESSSNNGSDYRKYNFFNNYYKPGPVTPSNHIWFLQPTTSCSNCGGTILPGHFYMDGNVMHGRDALTADNWKAGTSSPVSVYISESNVSKIREANRFATDTYQSVHTGAACLDPVLTYAGASFSRDAIDTRVAKETKDGTSTYKGSNTSAKDPSTNGLIDTQTDVADATWKNGWPVYAATADQLARIKDSDADGMPDWFEEQFGLNKSDKNDAGQVTLDKNSRYTNLEMYLHYLVKDIVAGQNAGGSYMKL